MTDIFIHRWSLLFTFDFSKDFVKDFDASKYMVLQNFLKNAKEFTCVCKRIDKYKSNQTITLPNFKKPFKTINK